MVSGGQGVYLWFLARELTRLGHRVDVIVGPPYPDPMPFAASVDAAPRRALLGQVVLAATARCCCRARSRCASSSRSTSGSSGRPGSASCPSRSRSACARCARVARRLTAGERWDIVHDVQTLGWGLLGIRALGLPVVTTIHHPLSVDRRASFVRDRSLREALGTMTFYPVGMQAPSRGAWIASSPPRRRARASSRRTSASSPSGCCMVANGVDTELFGPDPEVARDPAEILCVARASDPNKGVRTLVEALALLPEPARVTLVDEDHRREPRARARRGARLLAPPAHRRAASPRPSCSASTGAPRWWSCPRASRGSACRRPRRWRAARRWSRPRRARCPRWCAAAAAGSWCRATTPRRSPRRSPPCSSNPRPARALGAQGDRGIAEAYSWPSVAAATAEIYAETLAAARARRGRPAEQHHVRQRRQPPRQPRRAPPATPEPRGAGRRASARDQPGSAPGQRDPLHPLELELATPARASAPSS